MVSNNDIKNLEIYKEIVDQNRRLSEEMAKISNVNNIMIDRLESLTINISKLNDNNVLHFTEVNKTLKILTNKIIRILIYLVIALSILAGAEKASSLIGIL